MRNEIQENVKQKSIWIRGLYMILFSLFYSLAEIVLFASVIVQFFFKLFTGETNPQLLKLGQSIATYIYQIIQFLTFKSEYHVYPLGAWPKGEPSELEK
jgi:hypothetical protein